MTIRVVIEVPENQPGPVEVVGKPVDGQPWEGSPRTTIEPGQKVEFHVWGAQALQISEKPL